MASNRTWARGPAQNSQGLWWGQRNCDRADIIFLARSRDELESCLSCECRPVPVWERRSGLIRCPLHRDRSSVFVAQDVTIPAQETAHAG